MTRWTVQIVIDRPINDCTSQQVLFDHCNCRSTYCHENVTEILWNIEAEDGLEVIERCGRKLQAGLEALGLDAGATNIVRIQVLTETERLLELAKE